MYRRFLSVRYLRTRFVNFLSVAGVMMGVAVMIVVTSVMDGFQVKVREVLRGTLSHLIVSPNPGPAEDRTYDDVSREIRRHPDVLATAPQVSLFVGHPWKTARKNAQSQFHLMQAAGIDWAAETGQLSIPKNETPEQRRQRRKEEDARSVGKLAAYLKAAVDFDRPFHHPLAVDEDFPRVTGIFSVAFLKLFVGEHKDPKEFLGRFVDILTFREITTDKGETDFRTNSYRILVSAVYDSDDQKADEARFYLDRKTLVAMEKLPSEYDEVRVALKDYDRAAGVKRDLLERLPGFGVRTWEEIQEVFVKAINNEKVMLLVVLSFIVMLAGFTILATLTLTVVEKTRDIGVVKALGGTTGGILSIFLRSGLLIGIVGSLLGFGLGLFVTNHVNSIKDGLEAIGIHIFPPDVYFFREIPTHVDLSQVAGIVVGSILLSFFAGLPPALRAGRMDPVVALRHE